MAPIRSLPTALVLLCWTSLSLGASPPGPAATTAWSWACVRGNCNKVQMHERDLKTALSLEACKMFCTNNGTLWPLPTGQISLGTKLIRININNISVVITNKGKSDILLEAAIERFKNKIKAVLPEDVVPLAVGKTLTVNLVSQDPSVTALKLTTDESYFIETGSMKDGNMNATIGAANFFGLRHGLETLLQLIIYDDIRNEIQMVKNSKICDKPVFKYRGILLDTARNFYGISSIKRTIDAMAAVKLNTFHWHITDSQSFPFVSKLRPELSKYGALSPSKVYTMEAIKKVVQYGRIRGVRVLPEFDAPAHVGEGWQNLNMTVCFRAKPWKEFCAEPPCGQLNPAHPGLYDVLEDIYKDMFEAFEPDMFHMGGDEVSEKCWNTSQQIQEFMIQNRWGVTNKSFLKLWEYFQVQAVQRVYRANKNETLPIILWTSTLTDFKSIDAYLNNSDYIIQVWTTGTDPQVQGLLKKGYKLIMSNYDALYLDCGLSAWLGSGNANWCAPYIGWQKIYNNNPAAMAKQYKDQILGGEAALWSEQSDSSTVDTRLWPRAAAHAERLWTDPTTGSAEAEQRMLHIRERLVKLGVQPDSIQPEWCFQNEGECVP